MRGMLNESVGLTWLEGDVQTGSMDDALVMIVVGVIIVQL
jgi:hypothetical protein